MLVGVLGGGQLGRMLALAGYPLGLQFRFLDSSPDAPAGHVADLIVGAWHDRAAIDRFAQGLDAVTYEFENVPVAVAAALAERVRVFPPVTALETGQDRMLEKSLFRKLGIGVPEFASVDSRAEFESAMSTIGLPAVVKTRRGGYDGKGQAVIRSKADADSAWAELGDRPLLVERLVEFDREVSVLAVRAVTGETAVYPLVENVHRDGILRVSRAPAPRLSAALQKRADSHARAVMDALGYVGVLAIEFFQVGDELLANELAPRVHNSGHWTIEGAVTCQFENHVRAVAGFPLGDCSARGHSVMINLIGSTPPPADILAVPGARLHLYGKAPRPGRKLGHVTVSGDDAAGVERAAARMLAMVEAADVR